MVARTAKMGVKVKSIDKTLDKIKTRRDHFALLQEARKLRKKSTSWNMKEITERRLGEIDHRQFIKIVASILLPTTEFRVVRGLNELVL